MKVPTFSVDVIILPLSDVERALRFNVDQVGFRLDVDYAPNEAFRVVQVTAPGSGCSIQMGKGFTEAPVGSANREALRSFLAPETTRWQYTHGVPDANAISPDGYSLDNFYLARQGADEIQLDLLGDYKSNVALYPRFQNYSAYISNAFWPHGERTIPFSCPRVPSRSDAIFPAPKSNFSIRATSHLSLMPTSDNE